MPRTDSRSLSWSIARIVAAGAILAAIVAQLVASISRAVERGDHLVTVASNFFSFFTILSNALAAIVLLLAAGWYLAAGRRESTAVEPRAIAIALASVSTYMIITGIVYNILLRGIQLYPGTEPIWWSNEMLHLIAPLFLLADVLFGPRRRGLSWSAVWIIAAFPIVWVIYTLIRGPLIINPATGEHWWYPYPFLNPHNFDNGFVGVALYVVGIAIAIIAVGSFVIWWGRRVALADSSAHRVHEEM